MAGKFRFRLQTVLEQRERLERDRQRVVAEIDRERLTIEERLRTLQASIAGAKSDLRSRLVGAAEISGGGGMVFIPEVRAQAGASLHLEAQARRAALELAGAYRRLERARTELLVAATARKAVEILRERRHAEWVQENKRVEAVAVDEAATQQFARREGAQQGGEA